MIELSTNFRVPLVHGLAEFVLGVLTSGPKEFGYVMSLFNADSLLNESHVGQQSSRNPM